MPSGLSAHRSPHQIDAPRSRAAHNPASDADPVARRLIEHDCDCPREFAAPRRFGPSMFVDAIEFLADRPARSRSDSRVMRSKLM